jgi:hypothetical protein
VLAPSRRDPCVMVVRHGGAAQHAGAHGRRERGGALRSARQLRRRFLDRPLRANRAIGAPLMQRRQGTACHGPSAAVNRRSLPVQQGFRPLLPQTPIGGNPLTETLTEHCLLCPHGLIALALELCRRGAGESGPSVCVVVRRAEGFPVLRCADQGSSSLIDLSPQTPIPLVWGSQAEGRNTPRRGRRTLQHVLVGVLVTRRLTTRALLYTSAS